MSGEIDRLAVFMPPGSAKSTYSSVLFPPWFLAQAPGASIIAASHTTELAEKWGRRVRIRSDPAWSGIDAVRRSRVFLSPKLPYGWIDAPPSLNRLMGVRWLARLLFPGRFVGDIRDATRDFYHQFYQVDLSGAELDALLANPPEKR